MRSYHGTWVKLLLLLIITVTTSSCALFQRPKLEVNPIAKEDYFPFPEGSVVTIPAGAVLKDEKGKAVYTWIIETKITTTKPGWFISQDFSRVIFKTEISNNIK